MPLSSLPLDALHAKAAYCTPRDWRSLCSASRIWRGEAGPDDIDEITRLERLNVTLSANLGTLASAALDRVR